MSDPVRSIALSTGSVGSGSGVGLKTESVPLMATTTIAVTSEDNSNLGGSTSEVKNSKLSNDGYDFISTGGKGKAVDSTISNASDDSNNISSNVGNNNSNGKRVKKSAEDEMEFLRNKIDNSTAPDDLKERMHSMCDRLDKMVMSGVYSREYDILSNYIDWVTKFPWTNMAEDVLDLNVVKQVLDQGHFGLEVVKERVLQYMAVRKLLMDKKDFKAVERSPVICMVGLQGIGKTTLAKSISKALNRPFYRVSMGAIGSVLEIRGRDKAIEGAEPGQIMKAIIRTGVRNPIILLDELDKASGQSGLLADVMATMLEILDPEQNTSFRDHYFDYPVDLSQVMFIVSANKMGTFSAALLDRMEIIKMPSYTDEEKMVIARDYLLPRVQASTGILDDQLEFSPDVWPLIIRPLGFDSGIRSLQRLLENMSRKVALEIVTGQTTKVYITPQNFKTYLPRY